jgi:hypothetical protein
MQPTVKILYSGGPAQCDLAFGKLANFSGLKSVFLSINEYIAQVSSQKPTENHRDILALNCNTLSNIYQSPVVSEKTVSLLKNKASFLLIYGISPGSNNASALQNFTNVIVKDIIHYTDDENKYEVSNDYTDITKHFSGLSFGGVNKEVDFGLEVSSSVNVIARLVVIDGKSLFLRIEESSCCIFLLATDQIFDIDRTVEEIPEANNYFSGLVLPLMFLRHVFKDICWHNESEHASLIIDDPLINKKYGFLDYNSLLMEMDRHNFFTNIAFIPWNYRRTDKRIANIFITRNNRFAVCVHGCDHTKGGFGITNHREIDRKAKLSLRRMKLHKKKYGIPFDKVMVFPQGVFSTESMLVLKANNYLASVNSGFIPVGPEFDIKIRDVLEPAIMSYHSFPLYYRRIPGEIASFAFDLFMGKPALIVTHHYDYQKIESITGLVNMLNAQNNELKWTGLSDIANSSYLTRRLGEHEFQIRLYSPVVVIHNRHDYIATCQILKKESPDIRIKKVNINGRETTYEMNHDDLCINVDIPPKNSINIEIIYEELYSDTRLSPGKYTNLKIALRRIVSEIRDNHIAKRPLLLAFYNRLRKHM